MDLEADGLSLPEDLVALYAYRDAKGKWWLVYEYDHEPIGKTALDLPALIRFGLARMKFHGR